MDHQYRIKPRCYQLFLRFTCALCTMNTALVGLWPKFHLTLFSHQDEARAEKAVLRVVSNWLSAILIGTLVLSAPHVHHYTTRTLICCPCVEN